MHSLIRFADMLSFKIVKIYDVKYSPNIGRSAENILNLSVQSKTIVENVNIINWNEFDTLIIGHTHNLFNNIIKSDSVLHLLLSQAEAFAKNVFSFDQFPKSFENVPGFLFLRQFIRTIHLYLLGSYTILPNRFWLFLAQALNKGNFHFN